MNINVKPIDPWSSLQFENEDDRIGSFLDYLHKDQDNQSNLISDFQEYYFFQKPIFKIETFKRFFYGQMKKEGFFDHLKRCFQNPSGVKTEAVILLFHKLLDNNKCHQVDMVKEIWRSQNPKYIQECQFEILINQSSIHKDKIFLFLMVYLEGRLFEVSSLIKDQMAAQKYTVYINQKKKVQHSFNSSISSPKVNSTQKSHRKLVVNAMSRSMIMQNSDDGRSEDSISQSNQSPLMYNKKSMFASNMASQRNLNTFSDHSRKHSQRKLKTFTHGEAMGPESEESLSEASNTDSRGSSNDYFSKLDNLQQFLNQKRDKNARPSTRIKVPRFLVQQVAGAEEEHKEESISDGDNTSENRRNMFEFDIEREVKDLISSYMTKINLIYGLIEIENL